MNNETKNNKQKLITALRLAATSLESGVFPYEWNNCNACNCGVLACALTGSTPSQLSMAMQPVRVGRECTWTTMIGAHCPITGQTESKLFQQLFSFGLTPADLHNLEYLKDEKVLDRIQRTTHRKAGWFRRLCLRVDSVPVELDYRDADDTALYMRAWADILQEESQLDAPEQDQVDNLTAQKHLHV